MSISAQFSTKKSRASRERLFNSRSGQAAMEFLMTYGWAILVVLAAIAALAYFGVLSPAKLLPEKCVIEAGITCDGHKVEPTKITLVLTNSVEGRPLMINSIAVGVCSSSNLNITMSGGEQKTFTVGGSCDNGAPKDRFRGEIVIGYTEKNTNLTKTMLGNLNAAPNPLFDTLENLDDLQNFKLI